MSLIKMMLVMASLAAISKTFGLLRFLLRLRFLAQWRLLPHLLTLCVCKLLMLICILTKHVLTSCSVTMMLFLHLEVTPLMPLTTVVYSGFFRHAGCVRCVGCAGGAPGSRLIEAAVADHGRRARRQRVAAEPQRRGGASHRLVDRCERRGALLAEPRGLRRLRIHRG